jgi:hypothetical protein
MLFLLLGDRGLDKYNAKFLLVFNEKDLEVIGKHPVDDRYIEFWADGRRLQVAWVDLKGDATFLRKYLHRLVDNLCDSLT